ncbi:MAG: hypothetical protein HY721_20555 [Planctomycetes bacterium]|nr:hypothetical protein [Planctomycetota bacterium]
MVEVSTKAPTLRRARAAGFVRMALATRRLIEAGEGPVMVKAADPRMSIEGIRLLENTRGRSGVGG